MFRMNCSTVLVVEEGLKDAEKVSKALDREPVTIVSALADAAVQTLQALHDTICMVIPATARGLELSRSVRAKDQDVPIFLLTANGKRDRGLSEAARELRCRIVGADTLRDTLPTLIQAAAGELARSRLRREVSTDQQTITTSLNDLTQMVKKAVGGGA